MKMAEKAENKNAKDEKKNDAGEKQKEELEEKESEGEQEYELMPDWFIKEYNEAWAKAEAEHQGAQLSMVRRWEEKSLAKMTEEERAARPKVIIVAVEKKENKK